MDVNCKHCHDKLEYRGETRTGYQRFACKPCVRRLLLTPVEYENAGNEL